MKSISKCLTLAGAGLLLMLTLTVFPGTLAGDDWNLITAFRMNQQTEVPGAILEANKTYVIQVMDSPGERHVVQISNEDRSQVITTFMAISDPRLEAAEDTRFEYMESRAGYPVPIKSWFYPGHLTGLEFLYSAEQARNIATYTQAPRRTEQLAVVQPEIINQTAAVTPSEDPDSIVLPAPESVAQNDLPAVARPEPINAPEPEPPLVAQNTLPTDIQLPRTAGNTPFLGLAGLLSLAAGLSMRLLFRTS